MKKGSEITRQWYFPNKFKEQDDKPHIQGQTSQQGHASSDSTMKAKSHTGQDHSQSFRLQLFKQLWQK